MNKKDIAITVGICGLGWLAFPIILKLVKKYREKKEKAYGSENEKGTLGEAPAKERNDSK